MEPIGDPKTFGRLVRQRRKALGLRQKELALAVNVGERMIVDLEAGKETCQLGKALAIARAVGIRLVDAAAEPPSLTDDGYDLPDMGANRW
jgi:y4mF family transcriptional regulator